MRFIAQPCIRQNPNPAAPLPALLYFEADEKVRTRVALADPDRKWIIEFSAGENPAKGLVILGMRPDRLHRIKVTISNAEGSELTAAQELTYRTPPLPDHPYRRPHFTILRNEKEKREPGILLLSVHRAARGRYGDWTPAQSDFIFSWGMIVALDADGEIVWYYESDKFVEGISRLDNGNLLFNHWDMCTAEIDMLGNVVNCWSPAENPFGVPEGTIEVAAMGLHHQPEVMPNGNFLIMTVSAREIDDYYTDQYNLDGPREKRLVVGDGVAEMDPQTGELLWTWSAFDHLDPMRVGYGVTDLFWTLRGFTGACDWTHGNGASYDAGDDSVVISLRYQDALFKVDRRSGEIKWILGEDSGWGNLSGKVLKPLNLARWPYHGHNPRVTPEGTVVFFDNGAWGARPPDPPVDPGANYSRGVEYRIDEANMTVEEVWASDTKQTESSRHAPDMSDCHRLPVTGNMLVIWAQGVTRRPGQVYSEKDYSGSFFNDHFMSSTAREYARGEQSEIVFELELADPDNILNWGMYGGLVIPGLYPGN